MVLGPSAVAVPESQLLMDGPVCMSLGVHTAAARGRGGMSAEGCALPVSSISAETCTLLSTGIEEVLLAVLN